jgi:uncharacterized RDD family membrane protein YckC
MNKTQEQDYEYAGFWIRTGATIVDAILLMIITYPLLIAIYGWAYFDVEQTSIVAGPADFLISWVFPAIAIIWFWLKKQATPGKMAVSAKVVDATTGETLSLGQSIGRYAAYLVSFLPLGLGALWIVFDRRKQGWHDKLANTVVIRAKHSSTTPVKFE